MNQKMWTSTAHFQYFNWSQGYIFMLCVFMLQVESQWMWGSKFIHLTIIWAIDFWLFFFQKLSCSDIFLWDFDIRSLGRFTLGGVCGGKLTWIGGTGMSSGQNLHLMPLPLLFRSPGAAWFNSLDPHFKQNWYILIAREVLVLQSKFGQLFSVLWSST